MQFSGFLAASGNATSTEELFQLLGDAVSPLGYQGLAFLALTAQAQAALAPSAGFPSVIICSNYPKQYVEKYITNKCHEIDPILALAKESLVPLVYDDIIRSVSLSQKQKDLISYRLQAGLHSEITCPIHAPSEQTFVLCFTRNRPTGEECVATSALQVVSLHFYYSYVRIYQTCTKKADPPAGLADGPPMPLSEVRTLTQRERECLLWTARGKSASSISVILHLSENTINFYVKNAMRKLGTTNRVVAVVLAVRAGLIQP